MAVVQHASRHGEIADPWLAGMLARKPRKVVAVALADRTARRVRALATRKVTCKATTRNARGPVYEWLFAPKPERVKIRKGMSAPVLPKVEKENTHSSTWSGEAAAGGKVSVVVKDSTRFAHSHVTIEVTDGGWVTPRSLGTGNSPRSLGTENSLSGGERSQRPTSSLARRGAGRKRQRLGGG